jgi:hypothetical protein
MALRARVTPLVPRKSVPISAEQKSARIKLRTLYKRVKESALARDEAENERKRVQKEAVDVALLSDLADTHIRFSLNGHTYQGSITLPEASPVWDEEAIVEYLHRAGKWDLCSTQTFDPVKWEAEVTKGSIPRKTAEKFLHPGKPKSPYVRITEG